MVDAIQLPLFDRQKSSPALPITIAAIQHFSCGVMSIHKISDAPRFDAESGIHQFLSSASLKSSELVSQ